MFEYVVCLHHLSPRGIVCTCHSWLLKHWSHVPQLSTLHYSTPKGKCSVWNSTRTGTLSVNQTGARVFPRLNWWRTRGIRCKEITRVRLYTQKNLFFLPRLSRRCEKRPRMLAWILISFNVSTTHGKELWIYFFITKALQYRGRYFLFKFLMSLYSTFFFVIIVPLIENLWTMHQLGREHLPRNGSILWWEKVGLLIGLYLDGEESINRNDDPYHKFNTMRYM